MQRGEQRLVRISAHRIAQHALSIADGVCGPTVFSSFVDGT